MNVRVFGMSAFGFSLVFSLITLGASLYLPSAQGTQIAESGLTIISMVVIALLLFSLPMSLWQLMTGSLRQEFVLIGALTTIAAYSLVVFFTSMGDIAIAFGIICIISLILLTLLSSALAERKGIQERSVRYLKKFFLAEEIGIFLFQIVVAIISSKFLGVI